MRISIVIPVYDMPNGAFFLKRCLDSIERQTFKDYETVVTTKKGGWAINHNEGIRQAKGELIKFLHMDDYLTHPDSLKLIADNFNGQWLVTGCNHDPGTHTHLPSWNDKIQEGINTIGAPSVLTIKNENPMFFDENLSWLVDCDYYRRLYDKYGEPTILNDINVTIGIHLGQTTHLLADEIKIKEHKYMYEKYSGT